MRHTLVAAFATPADANRTYGDLMSRGIAREQIHTVGTDSAEIHGYDAPYSTADSTLDRTHHESKVAHFFRSLFGSEPHDDHRRHVTAYPEAVRRGATVIAVDVEDDDQLVRAVDALEYNGALDINEHGADIANIDALHDYAGPTSPYAGATGGDSHLDKHFAGSRTSGHQPGGEHLASREPASGPAASGTDDLASTDYDNRSSADTGRYDIGSAAKRAGTDYPDTAATAHPTGAGTTGHGTSIGVDDVAQRADFNQVGQGSDRVCVIQRPS